MGQISPLNPTRDSPPRSRLGGGRGFALLSPEFLDELRVRITLSQLIGRSVPLKKAGNEFKACCPFHNEKTPSFWVNDQKAFYHCFGCGSHGDAIRWLTEGRGLSFLEAVKQLADEVGLELPKPEPEEVARQERSSSLQEVMEAAAQHFERVLATQAGAQARSYLKLRELGETALSDFRIGYSPEGRNNILKALDRFTRDQLLEVGLLISVEGKEPYDRFRNRIMVPIRDPRGRVIAFGGRILGDGEPKYLNSPDTFLFDKGRILFNLDRAAPASRQSNRIVVVEGYFDVIALDQAGIRDAVAPMGTALTERQLEQIWRLVDEPILCFDGDAAGMKAAERAAERAMPSLRPGKQLQISVLPQGKDPDDLVRERGVKAFEEVLEGAYPLSTFLYRVESEKIDRDRPEQRAKLRERLNDLAGTCADRLVADEFARSFRDLFNEDFGWKRKHRRDILNSAIKTSPRVAPDLSRLYIRSALYGLTRFPKVAAENLEAIAGISIALPYLRRWRDGIVEAVMDDPLLECDGIQEVLSAHLLPEVMQFDIRYDLRFGFARRSTSRERAVKQLQTLISFLAEERELTDQMNELDKQAVADAGRDRYETIETSRQRLREARSSLFEHSADWESVFGEPEPLTA